MRLCPHRTATGSPLVWNDYSVFMDLEDWTRVKKLETTLVRDLGGVVEKELAKLKAEMVGPLNVRLLRDESGNVRPGTAVLKVDFSSADRLAPPDPSEMTVRVGRPRVAAPADPPTERVPGPMADGSRLKVEWPKGSTSVPSGVRRAAARTHRGAVRPDNQDAFVCRPDLGLFAVIDGMGGQQAGRRAAELAREALIAEGDPARGLVAASERICAAADTRPEL